MPAVYSPYIPASAGLASRFEGANAAKVAEAILKSHATRELLGLNSAAGYFLHGIHLSAATKGEHGLERRLTLRWQAMSTVSQARKGEENPIESKTVWLQRGEDPQPGVAWAWTRDENGGLHAEVC